mgnify:CR=1 FL=1
MKSMVFTCVLSALCLCAFADDNPTNIWKSVKDRAQAKGRGKKALWHELKQLSPTELLACGEDLYATETDRDGGNAIVANAVLSYHSKKTSPQATATAISRILRTSENAGWLKQCVMWIENNNHFLDVSPGSLRQMATAVSASIRGETDQSMAAREAVLDAAREDTFIMCLPEDSFESVENACRDLLAEGASIVASERLRRLASEYLEYASEGEKHRDEWKEHVKELRAKLKAANP